MPGAAIASIPLYVCYPRPVNAYVFGTGSSCRRSLIVTLIIRAKPLARSGRLVEPPPEAVDDASDGPLAHEVQPGVFFQRSGLFDGRGLTLFRTRGVPARNLEGL